MGGHGPTYPFPKLLLLLSLFPHVQLEENWDQSSVTPGRALRQGGKAQGAARAAPELAGASRGGLGAQAEPPSPSSPSLTWATAAK